MAAAAVATPLKPEDLPFGVRSNTGSIDDELVGWMRVTTRDTPIDEVRRRLRRDGYVFVKNVIPGEEVLKMRAHYFQFNSPSGLIKPGTDAVDGIYNDTEDRDAHRGIGAGDLPDSEISLDRLIASHATPEYLSFLQNPELRSYVRDIMDWESETLLTRTMLRHNLPGGVSTGVHYDKLFLRGGDAFFLTAWVPIGDCPAKCGGLIYLENSSNMGLDIENNFRRRAADLSEEERVSAFNQHMGKFGQLSNDAGDFTNRHGRHRWLAGNFEAGDVVFHDPYAIHAASFNEDKEGRIRLSCDLRFYETGSELDQRWMKLWVPGDGL